VLAVVAGGLVGCGTTPKSPDIGRTVEVATPVLMSCVPNDMPDEPQWVDTDEALKAADGPTRYQLVAAGRLQSKQWWKVVRPVLSACAAVPSLGEAEVTPPR
jgi:hypothetical protein